MTAFHHRAFQAHIAATYEASEHEANYSLERQVAQARREMGPERWAQLQAEWDAPLLAPVGGGEGV